MAEKDIAERHLLNYKDVFADIFNVCLSFILGDGVLFPKIVPEDLEDVQPHNLYISGGKIREQERDVVKVWKAGETVLCLMGLENQTRVDPDMPFRIIGYEGADYRRQLTDREEADRAEKAARQQGCGRRQRLWKKQKPYPVVTIVLYFGTKRRWPKNRRSLRALLNANDPLLPLVNDCRVHVIELAWLTEEQAARFVSDFRIVVDYLRQTRLNRDFVPSEQMMVHVDAVVHLLSALTGDRGLVEHLPNFKKRGVPMTVRNFFGEARKAGRAEGGALMARRLVADALVENFGAAPAGIMNRLEAISDLEALRRLAGRAWRAASLEDFTAQLDAVQSP